MSDVELERLISAALHAPVSLGNDARNRIMRDVRESSARGARPRRRVVPPAMRSARQSIVGLAMAASVGSVAVLSVAPSSPSLERGRPATPGNSVVGAFRDTLLLMRLIHDGEHRYAFVSDGARWAPERAISPPRADDRLAPMLRVASDSN